MKANEMMIGDWLLVHNKPRQIAIVEETCISYWAELSYSNELLTPSFTEIAPIPLTAEILEKNGFIKVNSQRYDYGCPDTDCYVKVNPKKNMIHINGRNANSNLYWHSFVHQLQHALRLCGLNDLADNFKVE